MSAHHQNNNPAVNSLEIVFVTKKTNSSLVEEIKKEIDTLASKYGTIITYNEDEKEVSEKILMKLYNHLTPNQFLTKDFFGFWEEFLIYSNELEEKHPDFVTLPMD